VRDTDVTNVRSDRHVVRHGLMLTGTTGSGKTKVLWYFYSYTQTQWFPTYGAWVVDIMMCSTSLLLRRTPSNRRFNEIQRREYNKNCRKVWLRQLCWWKEEFCTHIELCGISSQKISVKCSLRGMSIILEHRLIPCDENFIWEYFWFLQRGISVWSTTFEFWLLFLEKFVCLK
jgi:hypothetical protein